MSSSKKAFKVVYNLIVEGVLTEKEAYNIIEGIFEKEYFPVPVPTSPDNITQNQQEETTKKIEEVTVRGFVNNY